MSGGGLLQAEGRPCDLNRDRPGDARECKQGLVCHELTNSRALRGSGVCTRLQRYASPNRACDADLGVDACKAGHACLVMTNALTRADPRRVRSGTCRRVTRLSGEKEVCDASFGADACMSGLRCMGANGARIVRGIGYCN